MAPVFSEITRGFMLLKSATASVASSPGAVAPIPVPEVMRKGLVVPSSAAPMASITRRSFSQFSTKRAKCSSKVSLAL